MLKALERANVLSLLTIGLTGGESERMASLCDFCLNVESSFTPRVQEVHHLHLWNLASDVTALSAHVVVAENPSVHDAQAVTDDIRRRLATYHDIGHATIELECHPCDDPDDDH